MVNSRGSRWGLTPDRLLVGGVVVFVVVVTSFAPLMGVTVVGSAAVAVGTAVVWQRRAARRLSPAYTTAEQLRRRVVTIESEQLRLVGIMPGARLGPPSPAEPSPGPSESLVTLYESLHRKRVVVVGDPGSGKTIAVSKLAAELAERAIHTSSPEAPVPVMVGLRSWDPASQGVEDWFTSRVADRYRIGQNTVRNLVTWGLIIPVLDGLDELPTSQRPAAIPLLARWLAGFNGYVLTCRASAYQELAALLGTDVGTTVTLQPLPGHAVAAGLRSAAPQRWEPVATAIEADPGGPLAEVLSSPLLLSLAVSGYEGARHRNPAELTDREALPDAAAVRQRILDTADPTANILGRYGKAGRSRLELLTDATGRESDGLLLWWRMAEKYGSWRVTGYLNAALLGIPLLLFMAADLEPTTKVIALLAPAVSLLFAALQRVTPGPGRIGRSRFVPSLSDDRVLDRLLGLGVGAFLGALPFLFLTAIMRDTPYTASAHEWLAVLVACALAGSTIAATGTDAEPGRGRRAGDLRGDLWAALLASNAVTVLTCLPLGLFTWDRLTVNGVGLPAATYAALPAGIFVVTLLTGSAWGRYRIAHLRLVLDGELPLRLGRFLAEAEERGLLVPADGYGAGCYAFRHDLVREALSGRGADRQAHIRATVRFRAAIRTEVLTLPESVAHLARASDGAPEAYAREAELVARLTDEVLDEELRSVADQGFEAYERYRNARRRTRDAVSIPGWALPVASLCYGFLALVLTGVAYATLGMISVPDRPPLDNTLFGSLFTLFFLTALAFFKRWTKQKTLVDRVLLTTYRLGLLMGVYTMVAGLLAPMLPVHQRQPVLWTTAALATAFALAWLYTRPHLARARAVLDDDPANWPDLPSALSRYRDVALQAHESWLTALARDGVMPLIRGRLSAPDDTGTTPSLPAIAPARLTGSRRSDQFVGTAAADEIAFHLRELDSASIGVSGPRGAGKSSLMQRFCTPGSTSAADDLLVLVPAPTSYDPREFLIHLFAEVCRKVTGDGPADDGRPGFDPARHRTRFHDVGAALTTTVGVLMISATLLWPHLTAAARGITEHMRIVLISVGGTLIAAGLAWPLLRSLRAILRTRTRRPHGAEAAAALHLRTLHYQLTVMRTRNAQLALPAGLQLSDGAQTQHTQQLLTYPELVSRFRAFLDQVALERRAVGGRVVIGIDELDKLGSAQEAERFLNDLKVVFGIRGCHFLVAVSEDALTAFGRHVLDVRTVFDSAFDRIVAVRPLDLDQARTLLELRGVWLPEPYLWLCQVLSGGIPRDLLRAVTSLATDRTLRNATDMRQLMGKLIEDDGRAVLSGQTRHATTLTGDHAPAVTRWIADASQAPVTVGTWETAVTNAPAVPPDEYEARRAVTQVRTFLALGATLMWNFTQTDDAILTDNLERLRAAGPSPVDLLTTARAKLAAEPEASWAALVRCRRELNLWSLPELN